jgi:hypothetical protein
MFGLTPEEMNAIQDGPRRLATALSILRFAVEHPKGVTCEDCMEALKLRHQACSPRFSELERCGCLIETNMRKKTGSGASARLMKVAPDADFRAYMLFLRSSKRGRKAQLVKIAESFLGVWKLSRTKDEQRNAIQALLDGLIKADKNSPAG